MLSDCLGCPLDHAVAFAGLLVFHLAGRRDLETLFGAGFGLQFGHLALLIGCADKPHGRNMLVSLLAWSGGSGLSVNRGHGSPYWPGSDGRRYGRGGALMQPIGRSLLIDEKMPMHRSGASRASADRNMLSVLAWRQDHDHLAALEFRLLLDLCNWTDIVLHTVQQFGAQLLVRHFTAAKAQGDFDLIAVLKEALHRAHFYLVVVVVDHRPELDLLDLDDFLFFAGFRRLLLRLVLVLAVIQDFADRWRRVGGNFHQVETRCLRHV